MSGNRTLTRLSGIVSIVSLTVTTENQYANAVLPEGILVKKSDGVIYRTDGTHAIRDLIPVADQVLTSVEKIALSNAFSTGSYVIAPGGVVVHGSNGKINDSSLNIVASGKIKSSYLSDFVSNGMIKYAVLPEDVKTSFIVVNTYRDLLNLSAEDRKKLIIVIDSSGDPTNSSSGNSIYYYHNGSWQNVIMVANASVTYESVQAVSGVMYDHPLHLKTDDSNIHALLDALVIGEVVPDEPDPIDTGHDETAEYMEAGWEDFIASVNNMLNGPSSDLYIEDYDDKYSENYAMLIITDNSELDFTNATLTITCDSVGVNMTLPVTATVEGNDKIGIIEYNHDSGEVAEGLAVLRNFGNDAVASHNCVDLTVTDGVHTYTGGTIRAVFDRNDGLPSFNIPGFYSPFSV